jgi:hypothetical protein
MFELDPKLEGERIVVTWEPDTDFFPDGVTFLYDSSLAVTVENYKDAKYNKVVDPSPDDMLVGSPQLSTDNLKMNQIIEGGLKGAKYLLKFYANLTDGTQRVGVQAVIEVI